MFNLRMKVLFIGILVLFVLVGLRIYQIGVVEHNRWWNVAFSKPRVPYQPIPAKRGRILAKGAGGKGVVELVGNEPCFEVAVYFPLMSPDKWWLKRQIRLVKRKLKTHLGKDAKITIEEVMYIIQQRRKQFWDKLSKICGVEREKLNDRVDRIVSIVERRVGFVRKRLEGADYPLVEERLYYPVVGDIGEERALELRSRLEGVSGVMVRSAMKRVYKYPGLLPHILGRTIRIPGSVSKSFQIKDAEYLPGEFQGISGLERVYDKVLRGKRGWLELGKERRILLEPLDGKDIILTIDVELQRFVQSELERQVKSLPYATGGAVVVVDIKSNSIIAIASYPGYNLATFTRDYPKLINDYVHLPLFNRALMGMYPPGSIVKPMVAAYALSIGKITPQTTFVCRGYLSDKLKAFRCWLPPPGHGAVSMVSAIYNSCDVYFYHLGELIGADELTEFYRKIGFGKKVKFPLPNSKGLVPTQEWFIRRWSRGISVGDARNLAIGQGDLLITPLQAVLMLKTLLTNCYQPPRLVEGQELSEPINIGLTKRAIELAKKGMERTVNLEGATAYRYVHTSEIRLAGKTGSAQVPPRIVWKVSYKDIKKDKFVVKYVQSLKQFLKESGMRKEDVNAEKIVFPILKEEDRIDPYGRRRSLAHGWFVGYGSANHPRIVVCVFIEYGISGGRSAGPVFKKIMLKCKELGYIK